MEVPDSSLRPRKHHVVVSIDDEAAVLSSLRRLFRHEPFEFLATEKPDEAMGWILEKHASLVVADQRMPTISGLDLLEMVRRCSPSTMRIMLTAHTDLTGVLKLKQIEAIHLLLRKPWDPEELKQTLRKLLLQCEQQPEGSRRA